MRITRASLQTQIDTHHAKLAAALGWSGGRIELRKGRGQLWKLLHLSTFRAREIGRRFEDVAAELNRIVEAADGETMGDTMSRLARDAA